MHNVHFPGVMTTLHDAPLMSTENAFKRREKQFIKFGDEIKKKVEIRGRRGVVKRRLTSS